MLQKPTTQSSTQNHATPSRRHFLKLGAASAVAIAAAGLVGRWFNSGYSNLLNPQDQPVVLSRKEFAIALVLVDTLFPQVGLFPSGSTLKLAQRLDQEVWAAQDGFRSDIKNALQLLEHAPIALGYSGRFTSLTSSQREKYFVELIKSKTDLFRQVGGGLKELLYFFYYNNSKTWAAIGYAGPFVQTPMPPPSEVTYLGLIR